MDYTLGRIIGETTTIPTAYIEYFQNPTEAFIFTKLLDLSFDDGNWVDHESIMEITRYLDESVLLRALASFEEIGIIETRMDSPTDKEYAIYAERLYKLMLPWMSAGVKK